MPAVSVIVPARDAEATLARTLTCLDRQEGAPDFQVIVVDDGSRDRTLELARYFPEIAARMPELRRSMFYRQLFLSRRTAAFDLAAAGLAVAALTRSALPLAAALPYLRLSWRERLRRAGARAPLVGAVDAAADAVTLVALLRGSARARTAVL